MTRDEYGMLLAEPPALAEMLEAHLRAAATATRAIAELTASYEVIEARKALEIAAAVNEDGKPAYSNETARKAALVLALADDPEALGIEDDLHNTRIDRDEAKAVAAALKALVRLAAPGGL